MKRITLVLITFFCVCVVCQLYPPITSPAASEVPGSKFPVFEVNLTPLGTNLVVADMSSAVGLTVPDGAFEVVIQAQTGNLRWRDDGTDPTTTVGGVIYAGAYFTYRGDLSSISLIEESGADMWYACYGPPRNE